jgi:hypothetical protein
VLVSCLLTRSIGENFFTTLTLILISILTLTQVLVSCLLGRSIGEKLFTTFGKGQDIYTERQKLKRKRKELLEEEKDQSNLSTNKNKNRIVVPKGIDDDIFADVGKYVPVGVLDEKEMAEMAKMALKAGMESGVVAGRIEDRIEDQNEDQNMDQIIDQNKDQNDRNEDQNDRKDRNDFLNGDLTSDIKKDLNIPTLTSDDMDVISDEIQFEDNLEVHPDSVSHSSSSSSSNSNSSSSSHSIKELEGQEILSSSAKGLFSNLLPSFPTAIKMSTGVKVKYLRVRVWNNLRVDLKIKFKDCHNNSYISLSSITSTPNPSHRSLMTLTLMSLIQLWSLMMMMMTMMMMI